MVSQGPTTVDVSINTPDHAHINSMSPHSQIRPNGFVGSELLFLLINEEIFSHPFLENKFVTGRKAE